jgi:hypothetical protein
MDAPRSIDALPLALRRYVRDLETNNDNDLAGTIRENFRLHQENETACEGAGASREGPLSKDMMCK